ncbi:MAG: cytochrome c [bacterium]|nr:cytochrome c [bacterium]
MIKKGVFIAAVSLFSFSSCGDGGGQQPFNPPKGYKSRSGKLIYSKHCTSCHGDNGKLGSGGAKDLTVSRMDSTEIVDILRNGKNGMPRQIQYFKSDEEVENMIDHLKSMRK